QDPNFVIVGGIDLWRSTDGGSNFDKISDWRCGPGQTAASQRACDGPSAHSDQHFIVSEPGFDNTVNKKVFFGNDGGVFRTDDISAVEQYAGWWNLNHNLGVTQFYGGAASGAKLVGGAQDNASLVYVDDPQNWTVFRGGDGG